MNTFVQIGFAAMLLGCTAIYLASPNQRWLATALPSLAARGIGVLSLLLGGLSLLQELQALTAVFVFATLVMLLFSLLPYLAAWLGGKEKH